MIWKRLSLTALPVFFSSLRWKAVDAFSSCLLLLKYYSLWRSHPHQHQADITNTSNTAFMMYFEATDTSPSMPLFTHCSMMIRKNGCSNIALIGHEILQFKNNVFHFCRLTGVIIMICIWLSMIVMLAASVTGARDGECFTQGEIANLNGNT